MEKRQAVTAHDVFDQTKTFEVAELAKLCDDLETENSQLTQEKEALAAEIAQLKGSAVSSEEKNLLEAKVQELTALLSSQGGEHEILISQICRNPLQPRTVFPPHALQAFANILEEDGQSTPIILISLSDPLKHFLWATCRADLVDSSLTKDEQLAWWESVKFMLFDGERRWRSAGLLHWQTLRAVFKPPTDDNEWDLMKVQSEALCTTLHRQDLHPLNLAQVLIKQILYQYPDFRCKPGEPPEKAIPRVLGNVLARLQRAKKYPELAEIVEALAAEQQVWLSGLEFKAQEERWVLETLLKYHLYPVSIDANTFPLLTLPDDLKDLVYREGLDRSRLLQLNRLDAEALRVTEEKACQIRAEIANEVLQKKLKLSSTRNLVTNTIKQYNPEDDEDPQDTLPSQIQQVQKLNIQKLPVAHLKQLESAMRAKLKEIEVALTGSR